VDDGLVVANHGNLNAGLNPGYSTAVVGDLKANATLSGASNLRVGPSTGGVTLDTSLDTNASVDLRDTKVQVAANGTAKIGLDASGNTNLVNSNANAQLLGSTTTSLNTSLKTDVDVNAKLSGNTHAGSTGSSVVDSNADLDVSAAANLGSTAQRGVNAGASIAASLVASVTPDSVPVAAVASTGAAIVSKRPL
jgi:hypothetical protein